MEKKETKYYFLFQINCGETKLGESVYVTGNTPCIGKWNPEKAIKLFTNENSYPLWKSKIGEVLCFEEHLEYKYFIKSDNSNIKWESFSANRNLKLDDIEKMAKHQIEFTVEIHDERFNVNSKPKVFIGGMKENLKEIVEEESKAKNSDLLENSNKDEIFSIEQYQKKFEYVDFKISSYLENLIKKIVELNNVKKSWKDKLTLIWELLEDRKPEDLDKECLSLISIYLFYINTGQIKCSEDGTHFRPNHHAMLAFNVFKFLLKNITDENAILVRSILRNLPSFADQYLVSVPLTRIRDIAHRNDIPKDLKEEIKRTLQNKLHRSASPDDLKTCERIMNKITAPGENYSQDFIKEFKIFYEEIKEFFNALGLEKSLLKLKEISANQSLNEEIDKMLNIKSAPVEKTLSKLETICKIRAMLSNSIKEQLFFENKCNKSLLQISSTSEIELENFSYILMSEYLDKFYYNVKNISDEGYQNLISLALLCLNSLLISKIKPEECEIIKNDLIHFTINFVFESFADESKHRLTLLKLKSIFERCLNVFYEITEDAAKYFTAPAFSLGKALQINPHSIRVFSESFIRGHTIFQFSKIITILLNKMRQILKLPPFTTISSGEAKGYLLHLGKLADFDPEKYQFKDYIIFLKESDGSEEIPNEIKGVVLSQDLPQLSHLAIRARQNRVTFICCLDENIFKFKYHKLYAVGEFVKIIVEGDDLKIEKGDLIKEVKNNYEKKKKKDTCEDEDLELESNDNNDNLSYEIKNEKNGKNGNSNINNNSLIKQDFIISIHEATQKITGSKCSNMRELFNLKNKDYDTPESYCIPYTVYENYVKQILTEEDFKYIDTCHYGELEDKCHQLREKLIQNALKLNSSYSETEFSILEIIANKINNVLPEDTLLAFRSSSNLEDLKKSAGAGLFDSYLAIINNESNKDEIKHTICKVWASLFTYRGIIARRNNKIPSIKAKMGILIQKMILPDFCFVIHTVNPISKNKNEVYVELAIGMGETLASAKQRGSPYRIIYNKNDDSVIINNYASFSFLIKNGTHEERIIYKDQSLSTNDDYILQIGKRLGKISIYLEKSFNGVPQDIEGGVLNNQIYLMQTRPQII